MRLEATETALRIDDQDIFWSQITSTKIDAFHDKRTAEINNQRFHAYMDNRRHPYEKARKALQTKLNNEKTILEQYEALAGTLRAEYPLISAVTFRTRVITTLIILALMLPILLIPNPEGNTEQVLIELMVFVLGFSGLFWSALRPDRTYAKKPKLYAASDSEDVQKAFSFLSERGLLPKVEGLPSVDAEHLSTPLNADLLSKTYGAKAAVAEASLQLNELHSKEPRAPERLYEWNYVLSIITSSSSISTIQTHDKKALKRVQETIAQSIKNNQPTPFSLQISKEGDVINQSFGDVSVNVENTFNIDNASHYYKTENHGFTAEQVQTIVDSLVPSIQSLESAIEAHKTQSAESSAEVAELASTLSEIKECLAKAPVTEAEKTRAKELVSKFKDRIDDCSRLNAIYTLGTGALGTFKELLVGGVIA